MSTLLRLDEATRLFYGADELSAIYRDGEQLWPWSPQRLAGAGVTLAYWDANRLDSLFQERASGGTNRSVVNGVVGTVRDLSGGGRHQVAPSDAARPILRQSGSRYYLEFDGVDDTLSAPFLTGGAPAFPAFTGWCNQKRANSTTAGTFGIYRDVNNYVGTQDGTTGNRQNAVQRGNTGTLQNLVINTTSGTWPIDTTTVLMTRHISGQVFGYVNGATEVSLAGTFDPAALTSGTYVVPVWRVPANAKQFMAGVAVTGKSMSAAEIAATRKWLGRAGGLAL